MKKIFFALLVVTIIFMNTQIVQAWDPKTNHRLINAEAFEKFKNIYNSTDKYNDANVLSTTQYTYKNLLMSIVTKDTNKISSLLSDGGKREDNDPRYLNHFYIPMETQPFIEALMPNDLWNLSTGKPLTDLYIEGVYTNANAKDWALKKTIPGFDNPQSFYKALIHYKNSMETLPATGPTDKILEDSFTSLGMVMHLLADMTVPAHVRNDGHPEIFGNPDPLEITAALFTYCPAFSNNGVDHIKLPLKGLSPSSLFNNVALFTNNNFFSEDTIGSGPFYIENANGENPIFSSPELSQNDPIQIGTGSVDGKTVNLAEETPYSFLRRKAIKNALPIKYHIPYEFARSQTDVLFPIAIDANVELIDRFFPTMKLLINEPKLVENSKYEITGELKHWIAKDPTWSGYGILPIKYNGYGKLIVLKNDGTSESKYIDFRDGIIKSGLIFNQTGIHVDNLLPGEKMSIEIISGGRVFTSNTVTVPSSIIQNPLIFADRKTFDKNDSNQSSDINVMILLNGNQFLSIKNSTNMQLSEMDYLYDVLNNKVTIKKEYLAKLPTGTTILTFNFSMGYFQTLTLSIDNTDQPIGSINKSDIITATSFRMPISGMGNELSLLTISKFLISSYPKIRFNDNGDEKPDPNKTEWYVATAFNYNTYLNSGFNTSIIGQYLTSGAYHPGEDWNLNTGGDTDLNQPVYAIADGAVLYCGMTSANYGNAVLIVHKTSSGEYISSFYAHLASITPNITNGARINKGDQIGTVGNTGPAGMSPHLHFEIRKQSMIQIDSATSIITLKYPITKWPATGQPDGGQQFISSNFYNPSEFFKSTVTTILDTALAITSFSPSSPTRS
ncbi:MAG: Membrane metalloendopeptidase, partial [uncultured bacterium]